MLPRFWMIQTLRLHHECENQYEAATVPAAVLRRLSTPALLVRRNADNLVSSHITFGGTIMVSKVVRQVASGLTFIHSALWVHRDIKPANLAVQDSIIKAAFSQIVLGWLRGVVVLRCFVVVCAALWHGGS